ncbi:unnamed protein product [Ectocarpus fasciculatus]
MGTTASMPVLCGLPGCTRPCYDDGLVVHDYCGRTHAKQAASSGLVAGGRRSQTGTTCQLPGCSQPPFFDPVTNRTHDFCSKRHAITGASKCKLRGCSKNVYRDPVTGLVSATCSVAMNPHSVVEATYVKLCPRRTYLRKWRLKTIPEVSPHPPSSPHSTHALHWRQPKESAYCSRGHQGHAIALGQGMPTAQSHVVQVFRGGTTGATDFRISVLSKSHPQYSSLSHQFLIKWVKPGVPLVRRILEVKVPADIYGKYVNYKQAKGNVRRRFHGTSCSSRCNFFVDLKGDPCSSQGCNVCSICTNGFMLQGNVGGTARRTNYGLRYGDGLYFSSVSGKSNDYAQLSEKVGSDGKKVRCMFVANVTVGNAYLTQQVSLGQNMCPPAGHDSVVGEAGGGLNHDELVVYKNEAAIPSYLIVYALP